MPSPADQPILWLRSKTCALGPYRADLVETYWRWEQDPGALIGYGRQTPESLEARTEGMAHQVRGLADIPRFTVYDTAGEQPEPVGTTALIIDHAVRTAEFIIMLAREARGRGLGSQASRLTVDYGFHISGLRMIWLKVLAPNRGGIAAYERAGFREAGRLRQAGLWLGEVSDELLMDALAAEFEGPSAVREALQS